MTIDKDLVIELMQEKIMQYRQRDEAEKHRYELAASRQQLDTDKPAMRRGAVASMLGVSQTDVNEANPDYQPSKNIVSHPIDANGSPI